MYLLLALQCILYVTIISVVTNCILNWKDREKIGILIVTIAGIIDGTLITITSFISIVTISTIGVILVKFKITSTINVTTVALLGIFCGYILYEMVLKQIVIKILEKYTK